MLEQGDAAIEEEGSNVLIWTKTHCALEEYTGMARQKKLLADQILNRSPSPSQTDGTTKTKGSLRTLNGQGESCGRHQTLPCQSSSH